MKEEGLLGQQECFTEHGMGGNTVCSALPLLVTEQCCPECAFQGLMEVVVGKGGRWEPDPSSALYEQGLVALPLVFSLTLSVLAVGRREDGPQPSLRIFRKIKWDVECAYKLSCV